MSDVRKAWCVTASSSNRAFAAEDSELTVGTKRLGRMSLTRACNSSKELCSPTVPKLKLSNKSLLFRNYMQWHDPLKAKTKLL